MVSGLPFFVVTFTFLKTTPFAFRISNPPCSAVMFTFSRWLSGNPTITPAALTLLPLMLRSVMLRYFGVVSGVDAAVM